MITKPFLPSILILSAMCLFGASSSLAWANQPETEAEAFNQAVKAARRSPANTILLEQFIRQYPASAYTAEAKLEWERVQILQSGTYTLPNDIAVPKLTQLKPSREYLQCFYDGQKKLTEGADLNELRKQYEILEAQQDPTYLNEANYYLAYIDYANGNYDAALERFGRLQDDEKYAASVPFYRVQIQFAQANYDATLSEIQSLRRKQNLNYAQQRELNRLEGECFIGKKQNSRALAILKQWIENEGDIVPESAYNCAALAYETADWQLAKTALQKTIETCQKTPLTDNTSNHTLQKAYMLLGLTYMNLADYTAASMAFGNAHSIEADPKTAEAAAYNQALVIHETTYAAFGDEVQLFEAFLNQYPQSPYADKAAGYLSEIYLTTSNYQAALSSINKIKQPSQKILTAKQRLLVGMGAQACVNAQTELGIKYLNEAIGLGNIDSKSWSEAYYWRGAAQYASEQYKQAETDWNRCYSLRNNVGNEIKNILCYDLGYAQFKQNHFQKAIQTFHTYITQPSERGKMTYYDALIRLGDCNYYERNFSQAETYYDNASQNAPKGLTADYALFQKAFMEGLQKKYSAKIASLDFLIANNATSEYADDAWLEKGKTHLLMNNTEEAIKSFQATITQYPNQNSTPQAMIQLAMVYNNLGQMDAATKTYKQVVEKYPNTDEAQAAIEDLKGIYVAQNNVVGYEQYLAEVGSSQTLSSSERDSLNLTVANKLLADGNIEVAFSSMQNIITETGNTQLRKDLLPTAILLSFGLEKYQTTISLYEQLMKYPDIEALTMQESQLTAGKAYLEILQPNNAIELFKTAGKDMRTMAGAEAKFRLAETYNSIKKKQELTDTFNELITTGTPHQYWMARTIILMADYEMAEGDPFKGLEYLKSLKNNYKEKDDDIMEMIDERLRASQPSDNTPTQTKTLQ